MAYSKKLIYNPGGENENISGSVSNNENNSSKENEISEIKKDDSEHKTIIEKIKDALHDWSNKDEQDQEFDDTRV